MKMLWRQSVGHLHDLYVKMDFMSHQENRENVTGSAGGGVSFPGIDY